MVTIQPVSEPSGASAFLAKITRPAYGEILRRERLFQRLDESGESLAWIAAPAGAGKTTLAASYLVERDLRHLWYQLDARDADPATFFHYLGLAVRAAAPRLELALPHLTAEYALGLRAFARRYFETLAAQLKPPFVLVLDNYHELPADAAVHALIRDGIAILPAGFRALVLSRQPPRAALYAKLARLGWEDLQLTLEEVEGIERLRKRRAARTHRELHGESAGWAAGVVLLLERGAAAERRFSAGDPQALFDHFAGEIFSRLEPRRQEMLLASALLPRMSAAMLAELTGHAAAADVLEELHRRNYFTVKHAGASVAYEYHPLFRDFLLTRARQAFSGGRLQELRRRAAALAQADGQLEAAAELLCACGDYRALARLTVRHAAELLQQGRGQVLESWIARLPALVRGADPWLSYWQGLARLPFDPAQARDHFEQAYSRFRADGATAPAARAWCAIVDSYVFEWGNFEPLGHWLAQMQALLETKPVFDPALEAEVACGLFLATMYADPADRDMRRWEGRAREIMLGEGLGSLQAKLANHLLIYYTWWLGDLAAAQLLIEALGMRLLRAGTPPLMQIAWNAMAAGYYWMRAANAECLARVEQGLETSRTSGVHVFDRLLCSQGVFGSLTAGDGELARRYLDRVEAALTQSRPMDNAMYHYQLAWHEFSQARHARAAELARTAVRMAEQAGARFPAAVMRNDLGRVLFYIGDQPGAAALVRQAREEGRAMRAQTIEYLTFLVEAEMAMESGDEPACVAALREGLRVGAAQGFVNHTWWSSATMERLYAVALAHGIETDYVSDVIRSRGLH